jgi:hypothetical protein
MTKTIEKSALLGKTEDVLQVLAGFNALLRDETDAVKRRDFERVDALQQEKREFARIYGDLVNGLAAHKAEIAQLDAHVRDRLITARTAFTITLDENMRALDLCKRNAQRLANRILDAARLSVREECQTHYSAKGQMQAYKSSTLSMRVDETL